MGSYLALGWGQVAAAALLIVVNATISVVLSLGLGRSLLIASVRTVVQLVAVGFVLTWVFSVDHPLVVLGLVLPMTLVAGRAAHKRAGAHHPGAWLDATVSVWLSAWIVDSIAVFAIVGPEPWYRAQYIVPFVGMTLGNALTGISLTLDRLRAELGGRRGEIEGMLTLGATRWEAARDSVRAAIRSGMLPILNTMSVVGIVSLPGMMTGQLLGGTAPTEAVKYQIVIMFVVASATSLGAVSVALLSFRRLSDSWHRFAFDAVRSEKAP